MDFPVPVRVDTNASDVALIFLYIINTATKTLIYFFGTVPQNDYYDKINVLLRIQVQTKVEFISIDYWEI